MVQPLTGNEQGFLDVNGKIHVGQSHYTPLTTQTVFSRILLRVHLRRAVCERQKVRLGQPDRLWRFWRVQPGYRVRAPPLSTLLRASLSIECSHIETDSADHQNLIEVGLVAPAGFFGDLVVIQHWLPTNVSSFIRPHCDDHVTHEYVQDLASRYGLNITTT